jgi:predicted PurR-regulated permease PerM
MSSDNPKRQIRLVNRLWLLLISLTLFSAFMAEQPAQGLISIFILAVVLAVKGRIIVDYFMELKGANKLLRTLMQVYFYVIPLMIIAVYLFPEQIASWATLK